MLFLSKHNILYLNSAPTKWESFKFREFKYCFSIFFLLLMKCEIKVIKRNEELFFFFRPFSISKNMKFKMHAQKRKQKTICFSYFLSYHYAIVCFFFYLILVVNVFQVENGITSRIFFLSLSQYLTSFSNTPLLFSKNIAQPNVLLYTFVC